MPQISGEAGLLRAIGRAVRGHGTPQLLEAADGPGPYVGMTGHLGQDFRVVLVHGGQDRPGVPQRLTGRFRDRGGGTAGLIHAAQERALQASLGPGELSEGGRTAESGGELIEAGVDDAVVRELLPGRERDRQPLSMCLISLNRSGAVHRRVGEPRARTVSMGVEATAAAR